MAKRYLNTNYTNLDSKRLKMNINKLQTYNNNSKINSEYNSSCNKTKNDHIWDDDDDVILLATQVAEEAVNSEQIADDTAISHECSTINTIDFHSKNLKHDGSNTIAPNSCSNAVFPSTLSSQRRQLASERQIQFLLEKVQSFKQEDEKLRKDLSDMRAKLELKDGEAALIREELLLMKQQLHNMKMKNTLQVEASVNERDATIANLSKYVEVKEAEFKLKQVHSAAMKSKCLNESQMSYQNCTPNNNSITTEKYLMKIFDFNLDLINSANHTNTSVQIMSNFNTLQISKWFNNGNIFISELQRIKNLLISLQLSQMQNFNTIIETCLASFSKVITELFSYSQNLSAKQKSVKLNIEHRLQNTINSIRHHNRGIEKSKEGNNATLNDYLNTLTLILERVPALAHVIVQHKIDNINLLQIITEAVIKLYSIQEIQEYYQTLKAVCSMLVYILKLLPSNIDEIYIEMLINLLKQLIIILPETCAYIEITACLWEGCHLSQFLDLLCLNQSSQKALPNQTSLAKYPPNNSTCVIQIYCDILPSVFNSNMEFKLLCSVCLNHMRFVHHCFTQPPKFIYKHLPSFDLEVDDNHENQNHDNIPPKKTIEHSECCDCYLKLALTVSSLLFRLFKLWIFKENKQCADWISRIVCLSVYTLHIILRDYDLINSFHYLQDTTKHHLHSINKWLLDNTKILNLDELTIGFINKLNQSNIAFKTNKADINLDNLLTALNEWQQLTNDIDDDKSENISDNNNVKENKLSTAKLQIFDQEDAHEQTYFTELQEEENTA